MKISYQTKKHLFPIILLAIGITGPPRPRYRSAGAIFSDIIDPGVLFEVSVWMIILLYAGHLFIEKIIYKNQNSLVRGPVKLYLIYSVLALISAGYSVYPLYTLYAALKFIALFLIALHLADKFRADPWFLYKIVFLTSAVVLAVQVISYLIEPTLVGVFTKGGYRMTGGWLGGYGSYALYSLVGIFLLYQNNKIKRIASVGLFLVCLYFLYLSRTRQSYFFFLLIFITFILWSGRFKYSKYNFLLYGGILIASIFLLNVQYTAGLFFVRDYGSLSTLSARTTLMAALLDIAKEYLPFGQGFGIGARYWLIQLKFAEMGLGGAHEAISTILLELGIPGVVMILLVLFSVWRQYIELIRYAFRHWKTRLASKNYYLLSLFLGANLLFSTVSVITTSALVAGKWNWIVLIVTLQALHQIKNKEILYARNQQYADNIGRYPLLQPG